MSDLSWKDILSKHRLALMGVVNVTPDSFSDGGLHFDLDAAERWWGESLREDPDRTETYVSYASLVLGRGDWAKLDGLTAAGSVVHPQSINMASTWRHGVS